jgi:hypothetical protein
MDRSGGVARYPAQMSGYVASARVRGVPRLVRTERAAAQSIPFGHPEPPRVVEIELEVAIDGDRTLEQLVVGLAERAVAFRERWSQLTFYLFDPNSWR